MSDEVMHPFSDAKDYFDGVKVLDQIPSAETITEITEHCKHYYDLCINEIIYSMSRGMFCAEAIFNDAHTPTFSFTERKALYLVCKLLIDRRYKVEIREAVINECFLKISWGNND